MHELTFDYQSSTVLARCGCGGWEREARLWGAESSFALVERLEEEHTRHVAECLAPLPGRPARPVS
jgi:hypothetical protein